MAEKKQKQRGGSITNTELVNVRFYENQKRQALLTTTMDDNEDDDGTGSDDKVLLSSVATTENFCDTVADVLKSSNEPQLQSSEAVSSVDSTSSTLAISAPSDKSRKGSVDQKIWNLVNLINREKDSFFTTSSCSGRIILYTWKLSDGETPVLSSASIPKQKKGCKWLLVSHDEVEPEELVNAYLTTAALPACQEATNAPTGERDVYFKMEPCILHVQCRTLSQAKKLIHISTESGFRNSGMVIGKENRITVAIRSAMGLEVPLPLPAADSDAPNIRTEYLKYLTDMANSKMRENWLRSEKLTRLFSETLWNA